MLSEHTHFFSGWCQKPARGVWLGWGLWVLVCLLLILTRLQFRHSIRDFIPPAVNGVGSQLHLLQALPASNRILVVLKSEQPLSDEVFMEGLRELCRRLKKTAIEPDVELDPKLAAETRSYFIDHLCVYWPQTDAAAIVKELFADGVIESRIRQARKRLLSPEGIFEKPFILRDPLGLHERILADFGWDLKPGGSSHWLLNRTRTAALITAKTAVPFTDFRASQRLLEEFREATAGLPHGLQADFFSGHRFTLANATCIQQDLRWLLGLSLAGLMLLGVLYLRWRGGWTVLLVPLTGIVSALGVCALVYPRLNLITLGFGSVLMGITVDFGLHMVLALYHRTQPRSEVMSNLLSPLLFCALTTAGVFGVLFFCQIPIHRQLALFTVTGIVGAWLFAFFGLPRIVYGQLPESRHDRGMGAPNFLSRRAALLILPVLVGCAIILLPRLRTATDLNALNYIPSSLQRLQKLIQRDWPHFGRSAFLVIDAESEEQLEERCQKVATAMQEEGLQPLFPVYSQLLPPRSLRDRRRQAWRVFLKVHGEEFRQRLIRAGWPPMATERYLSGLAKSLGTEVSTHTLKQTFLRIPLELGRFTWRERPAAVIYPRTSDAGKLQRIVRKTRMPGITILVPGEVGRTLAKAITHDFMFFSLTGSGLCLILVIVLFRRFRLILAALVPVLSGLAVLVITLAVCRIQLTLFNVMGALLVAGLAVDYGIFMVHWRYCGQSSVTIRAIELSAFSTLAGFGVLVMARHPAMFSLGVTVLPGIIGALTGAIFLVPGVLQDREHKSIQDWRQT